MRARERTRGIRKSSVEEARGVRRGGTLPGAERVTPVENETREDERSIES
jgi:hypothetical protein